MEDRPHPGEVVLVTRQVYYPASEPDWAVPPGETLLETMQETDATPADMARRTGLDVTRINLLSSGGTELTEDDAARLEEGTGIPARLWLRMEANYRAALIRAEAKAEAVD